MKNVSRLSVIAAIALASIVSACATADLVVQADKRSGHFGAGMHAGRTTGR